MLLLTLNLKLKLCALHSLKTKAAALTPFLSASLSLPLLSASLLFD